MSEEQTAEPFAETLARVRRHLYVAVHHYPDEKLNAQTTFEALVDLIEQLDRRLVALETLVPFGTPDEY